MIKIFGTKAAKINIAQANKKFANVILLPFGIHVELNCRELLHVPFVLILGDPLKL